MRLQLHVSAILACVLLFSLPSAALCGFFPRCKPARFVKVVQFAPAYYRQAQPIQRPVGTQQTGTNPTSVSTAINALRVLFKAKGLKLNALQQPFSPAENEPLIYQAAWDSLQYDVGMILQRHLGLRALPYIELRLQSIPASNQLPEFYVIFSVTSERNVHVIEALSAATGLPLDRFFTVPLVCSSFVLVHDNIRPDYLFNGKLHPVKVRQAVLDVLQADNTRFKNMQLSPSVTVLDERIGTFQLTTTPVRIKQSLLENTAHFWRLHVRLDYSKTEDYWSVLIRIDVGNAPIANARDVSKINFRVPTENTDCNDKYKSILLNVTKNSPHFAFDGKTRVVRVSSSTRPEAPERLAADNPTDISTLGDLVDSVYYAIARKLLLPEKKENGK